MSFQPFGARAGHRSGRHFFGDKSPAPRAREPFKPSTDLESLLVSVDKFSLIYGSKPCFWQTSKSFTKGIICHFRPNFGQLYLGSRWARELFKPCKDWLSFVHQNEKKHFKFWTWGFFVDDVMSGVCFAFLFMTSSPIQWADIMGQTQSLIGI